MNIENYQLALAQIIARPETWDQRHWHCETAHCIGGWGQIFSGRTGVSVRRDAREFFDISFREANYLFAPDRTLEELKSFPAALAGGKLAASICPTQEWEFRNDGYDADGLDRHNKPRPA